MRRKNQMLFTGFAAFLVMMFAASSAFGLDGYQKRKNVFGGLGAGGGLGMLNESGELTETGPGLHVQGVLGGGVTEHVLIGAEADWWVRMVNKGEGNQFTMHHGSIGPVANFFIVGGLHLDAGAGFAYGICSGERFDESCRWQELGFEGEAGLGYEFWFNGTTTGGINLRYTHHFYSASAFDTVTMTLGLRFY